MNKTTIVLIAVGIAAIVIALAVSNSKKKKTATQPAAKPEEVEEAGNDAIKDLMKNKGYNLEEATQIAQSNQFSSGYGF